MTQTPYAAAIEEGLACQRAQEGVDRDLTIWHADIPECTLSQLLGIEEVELVAFAFGRDAPPRELFSTDPDVAPIPLPAGLALLLSALAFLAFLRRRVQ